MIKSMANPDVLDATVGFISNESSIGIITKPPPIPSVPAQIPEKKENKHRLFIELGETLNYFG